MENKAKVTRKRCVYCGRFFKPDYRVGDRQKSCRSSECRSKRKRESQRRWVEANPGYFQGRYENTKQWRKLHPDYQRRWRAKRREIQEEIPCKSPIKTIRLLIPVKYFKGEIQDEIRLVRQCGCGFFVAGKAMQDTRQDCLH
jgi:hypothetical protein